MASITTPGTSKDLVARMQEAWLPFRIAAASLGHKRLEEPTPSGWTYKQMLGHVAAWHELAARRLRDFRTTGQTERSAADRDVTDALFKALGVGAQDREALLNEWDMDRFNAAIAAASVRDDAAILFRKLDGSFERLRDEVAQLTDDQVTSHVADGRSFAAAITEGDSYGHYGEHLEEIRSGIPRTAAELLERLKGEWLPFRSTVESLGLRELTKRTPSGWTVKGLLGHLTHWMETVPRELPARLRGERPAPADINAENAAASADADAQSTGDVLRALDRSFEAVVAALADLDGAREIPAMVVGSVAARTYANFLEHTSELRALWPRSRDELIARIEVEWRTFRDAVRQLGRARLGETIGDAWTYKDMLAHVAAWLSVTPQRIAAIRGGQPDPVTTTRNGVDEFNRRAVESRRLVGPEAMLDELDTSYRRFLEAVRTVTDDEVASGSLRRGILSVVAWESYLHFEDHYAELGVAIP